MEPHMKKFLVSYDLDKPGQDYPRIWKELERLGAKRALYSQWVMKSDWTAAQLRDYFRDFIDSNDRLLVVSLEDDWASQNAMFKISTMAA
jgi:hypothetical protein